MTAREVIARYRYRYANETELQACIAQALATHRIAFEREVQLGPGDRIDFMCGGLGIEVKIKGSLAAVTRQLHRYAQHERVKELALVTSLLRLGNQPAQMNGKPLGVINLGAFS